MTSKLKTLSTALGRFFPTREFKPSDCGLGRKQLIDVVCRDWLDWDPTRPAPLGWSWLADTARPTSCLVRYSNGRLDRITRRDWYKARQHLLKLQADGYAVATEE